MVSSTVTIAAAETFHSSVTVSYLILNQSLQRKELGETVILAIAQLSLEPLS
jgi:hypothetical protein